LPELLEDGVGSFFLLIRHALVECLEHRNQLTDCFGMRRGELCVPTKSADRVRIGALGPLLKQSMHRLRVVAHHIRVSPELGFLSGGNMELLVKLRYPGID